MRFASRGAALAIVTTVIVGCTETNRPSAPRPAKPVVATVVLKVPGMT